MWYILLYSELSFASYPLRVILYDLLSTTYSLRLTLCDLLSTTYSLRLTLHDLLSTTYCLRLTVYDLLSTTYSLRLILYDLFSTIYFLGLIFYDLFSTTCSLRLILPRWCLPSYGVGAHAPKSTRVERAGALVWACGLLLGGASAWDTMGSLRHHVGLDTRQGLSGL